MKKTVKVILSVILCLALSVAVTAPCFAKEGKTAFVVVSGMNTFPLTLDGEKVFPMSTKTIVKQIPDIAVALMNFAGNRDYVSLNEQLYAPVGEIFKLLACDSDGNSVYDVKTMQFPDSVDEYIGLFENEMNDELGVVNAGIKKYGAENTYFFNYDWRLDPLDHADKLNELIKTIKAKNEYDRIEVSAYSMGGTVVCSYLYKYGSADIDSLALVSTAFQGTSCVGDLFSGKIELSATGLMKRLSQLTRDNTLEDLINGISSVLKAVGVLQFVEDISDKFVSASPDELYSELLTPAVGYMQGLWALCDDVNYEDAKKTMLHGTSSEAFIKEIDEYHYNVQQKAEELLKSALKDTAVYLVAQYNMQGLPVSAVSSTSNNDYLIDTAYEAGGAICADLGKTMPDDYVQKVDCGHNHISFDRQIDASTGMLPEYTWFIRDMGHVDFPVGESTDFIIYLVHSEKQLTVFDSPEYPQFLKYNYGDGTLKPVNEESLKKTVADNILELFNKLVDIFSSFLSLLFQK